MRKLGRVIKIIREAQATGTNPWEALQYELETPERKAAIDRERATNKDLARIDAYFDDPGLMQQVDTMVRGWRDQGLSDADAAHAANATRRRQRLAGRGLASSAVATRGRRKGLGSLMRDRLGVASRAVDLRRRFGEALEGKRQDLRNAVAQGRLRTGQTADILGGQARRFDQANSLLPDSALGDIFNTMAIWNSNQDQDSNQDQE